jgi:hypothetical protein
MCCSAGIIGPGTRTMVKYFWHPTVLWIFASFDATGLAEQFAWLF